METNKIVEKLLEQGEIDGFDINKLNIDSDNKLYSARVTCNEQEYDLEWNEKVQFWE